MSNAQHHIHPDSIASAFRGTFLQLESALDTELLGIFAVSLCTGLTLHQLRTSSLSIEGGEEGNAFELLVTFPLPKLKIAPELVEFVDASSALRFYLPSVVVLQLTADLETPWRANDVVKEANKLLKSVGVHRSATPARLAKKVRELIYRKNEGVLVKASLTQAHYCHESNGSFFKQHYLALSHLLNEYQINFNHPVELTSGSQLDSFAGSNGIMQLEEVSSVLKDLWREAADASDTFAHCASLQNRYLLHNALARRAMLVFCLATCTRHLRRKAPTINDFDIQNARVAILNKSSEIPYRMLPIGSLLGSVLDEYCQYLNLYSNDDFIASVLNGERTLFFTYEQSHTQTLLTMKELNAFLFNGKKVNQNWPRKTVVNWLFRRFSEPDVAAYVEHDREHPCPVVLHAIAHSVNVLLNTLIK
ncbi:hypothetical protein M0C34_17910 [Agarivorans sp. TSD2052]|uniref:hypothetical protein n=1 Tax=Agarivorans sp. TSD2052 TaxID=2937286 RepID=UPI00200DDE1E|nr:hypothetical protein [Agarivorans sp. TSD2052]UPW18077.1 hypothetical protein M0C34_17910 [Agarivorans sp. TSD2052]